MSIQNQEPWLTVKQLAKELKTSTSFIYRMTHCEAIPYISIGRSYRYKLSEVVQALRNPAFKQNNGGGYD